MFKEAINEASTGSFLASEIVKVSVLLDAITK